MFSVVPSSDVEFFPCKTFHRTSKSIELSILIDGRQRNLQLTRLFVYQYKSSPILFGYDGIGERISRLQ